jgi:hypothetical protein
MKTSSLQERLRIFPGISEEPEVGFEVEVGRLLCGDMREMLESEVFCGRPIRWREGKGWLSRTFVIVGPEAHVAQVKQRIDYWAAVNQQIGGM